MGDYPCFWIRQQVSQLDPGIAVVVLVLSVCHVQRNDMHVGEEGGSNLPSPQPRPFPHFVLQQEGRFDGMQVNVVQYVPPAHSHDLWR